MNWKRLIVKMSAVSLLGLSAALITSTEFVPSAEAQAVEGRQFGSASGQIVNDAQTLGQASQYSAAISKLNEAIALPELNAYERSTIYSMMGTFFYQLDDLGSAISNFQNAINGGGLLPNESSSFENQIAQLLIADGRYVEGAQRLEAWIRNTGNNDPKYNTFVMQAYVKAEQYRSALPYAETWFRTASPKKREHFDLLNFLYNNLGMQGRQADIIKDMIIRWPEDKLLWDNWISLLSQGGRDKDAFEVNKMLYLAGTLTSESDIKKVVEYYQYYEMPFQAAQILEREMNAGRVQPDANNLVRLSELFRQAREYERALPILKRAAEASGRSKSWAQYGEALYNQGRCQEAETNLKRAMEMGYDRGKSWMLIANCRYEEGQKEERPSCVGTTPEQRMSTQKVKLNEQALTAFRKVPATAKDYRSAQKWIDFVSTENKSFETRCEERAKLAKDLCMIKIENAYKLEIIKGGFILKEDDKHCVKFKDEYDKEYRTVKK